MNRLTKNPAAAAINPLHPLKVNTVKHTIPIIISAPKPANPPRYDA